jgi:hypothetical protein
MAAAEATGDTASLRVGPGVLDALVVGAGQLARSETEPAGHPSYVTPPEAARSLFASL